MHNRWQVECYLALSSIVEGVSGTPAVSEPTASADRLFGLSTKLEIGEVDLQETRPWRIVLEDPGMRTLYPRSAPCAPSGTTSIALNDGF